MKQTGVDFLNKLYQDLHMSKEVMHTASKSDTPQQKIEKYLDRLDKVHNMANTKPHRMDLLRQFYYDKYVIKELPKGYVDFLQNINNESGKSNKKVDEAQLLLQVQSDQKASLDQWLDYFVTDDIYPMWFKYYAFNGMLKLNSFDKDNEKFGKRSRETTDFYVELNREALAQVYNTLVNELDCKELSAEQENALEQGNSFAKLYMYYLQKQGVFVKDNEIDGQWIKYEWGRDYIPLWESLQGKYTGWCTAGKATAKDQLSHGDFYVYYTKDKDGEYTRPRIAIRMSGSTEIEEVRGVEAHQNLESNMIKIAEEKLKTFPDYTKFKQRLEDMDDLTLLQRKIKRGEELNKDDISLLYEIDHTVKGFGYERDPRIEAIKNKRDTKKDLMYYFDCGEENIGYTPRDFSNRDIVVYIGDLPVRKVEFMDKLASLKMIIGTFDYTNETDASYLENLICVDGSALFRNLKSSKGLDNLKNINGNAYFNSLNDVSGFKNLKNIGGYILAPEFSDDYLESIDFLNIIKNNSQEVVTDNKIK